MNMTRTFIAVAVPEALELKLTRLQARLAGEAPEGRWSVPPPFHVTLAFLGDVETTDLNDLCRAVAASAAPLPRFELKLEGLGAFPNAGRPRVVWTGVGGPGLEPLKALQAAVAGAAAGFIARPDPHPFHAHVTLGRFGFGRRPAHDLTPRINHYRTWHAGPFAVTEAVVFSSNPGRDGEAYAPLARAPLRARKPDATP